MKRLLTCLLLLPLAASAQDAYDSLQDLFVDTAAFYTDTTGYGGDEYIEEDYGESYDYSDYETESPIPTVPPENLETTAEYKAQEVKVNKFDEEKWKSIVGSTDYNEEKEEEEAEEAETLNAPKMNLPWTGAGLQMFSYGIIIAIVLVILYFILRNFSFDKKIKKTQLRIEDFNTVEDIEELDVEDLLRRAIAETNFKLAVRLYFLRLLKSLHAKQIIHWKKDKTNSDYLSELFNKGIHYHEIKKLTLAYEQVWYGEHAITPEVFGILKKNFESIQQNLQESVNP